MPQSPITADFKISLVMVPNKEEVNTFPVTLSVTFTLKQSFLHCQPCLSYSFSKLSSRASEPVSKTITTKKENFPAYMTFGLLDTKKLPCWYQNVKIMLIHCLLIPKCALPESYNPCQNGSIATFTHGKIPMLTVF